MANRVFFFFFFSLGALKAVITRLATLRICGHFLHLSRTKESLAHPVVKKKENEQK